MKCTREEFSDKIWAKYPDKYIYFDQYLNAKYASDNPKFFDLDHQNRWLTATQVWQNGEVIKDTTGIFTQQTVPTGQSGQAPTSNLDGSITWTYPSWALNPLKLYINGKEVEFDTNGASITVYNKSPELTVIEPKFPVCECGKEKHGFASHAQWCDIKE